MQDDELDVVLLMGDISKRIDAAGQSDRGNTDCWSGQDAKKY